MSSLLDIICQNDCQKSTHEAKVEQGEHQTEVFLFKTSSLEPDTTTLFKNFDIIVVAKDEA